MRRWRVTPVLGRSCNNNHNRSSQSHSHSSIHRAYYANASQNLTTQLRSPFQGLGNNNFSFSLFLCCGNSNNFSFSTGCARPNNGNATFSISQAGSISLIIVPCSSSSSATSCCPTKVQLQISSGAGQLPGELAQSGAVVRYGQTF